MTQERRFEMRYYRDQAVSKEKHQRSKVVINNSNTNTFVPTENNKICDARSNPLEGKEKCEDNDQCTSSLTNRRNSYTLECPSPAMIDYLLSVNDNIELNAAYNYEDSSHDSTNQTDSIKNYADTKHQPNIHSTSINTQISVCENELCLDDLNTSFSLPNDRELTSTPNSDAHKHFEDARNSFQNECQHNTMKPAESYFLSDSMKICSKSDMRLEELKNLSTDQNGSCEILVQNANDLDTGRVSIISECSSVSLSKFLNGKKLIDNESQNVKEDRLSFDILKQQLDQKHETELMRLLEEQRKEVELLEKYIVSLSENSVSSPKTNYIYSEDVVLRKYIAENTLASVPASNPVNCNDDIDRSSSNCRRKIYSSSSEDEGMDDSKQQPILNGVAGKTDSTSTMSEIMNFAATKINAAVKGYLVRRLFKTIRVEHLLKTINECLSTAFALQNEDILTPEDLQLQHRVLQQSISACNEIQFIFSLPVKQRLEMIAIDRDHKNRLTQKVKTPLPLTDATKKKLQRRKSVTIGSKSISVDSRKRSKSASCDTRRNIKNTIPTLVPIMNDHKTSSLSRKISISQGTKQTRKTWL